MNGFIASFNGLLLHLTALLLYLTALLLYLTALFNGFFFKHLSNIFSNVTSSHK